MSLIYGPLFNDEYSMSFDGTDDYIGCGRGLANFTFNDPFSISIWFKPISFYAYATFISKTLYYGTWQAIPPGPQSQGAGGWTVYMNNQIQFVLNGNRWNDYTLIQSNFYGMFVLNGSWHHLVVTYNGTRGIAGLKMYLDTYDITGPGAEVINGASYLQTTGSTEAQLIIGNRDTTDYTGEPGAGQTSKPFNGSIDEVSIFDYVLSQTQINTIYSGIPPSGGGTGTPWDDGTGKPNNVGNLPIPPIAWYRMGDNAVFKDPQWLLPENSNKDKVSNYSMDFDGTDDSIEMGDVLHQSGTTTFSLSAWVKVNTNAGHTVTYPIMNKRKKRMGPTYTTYGYGMYLATSGAQFNKLGWSLIGDTTTGVGSIWKIADIISINDGIWHHVVTTYNGSRAASGVTFYIDGVKKTSTQTLTDSFTGANTNDPTVNFKMGKTFSSYGGGRTEWFDGSIDEAAIFDIELSQTNISFMYSGGTNGIPPDLSSLNPVGYWKMGDMTYSGGTPTTGTTIPWVIPDSSTNNNIGLAQNMDIEDRVGNAPNSSGNTLSYNMELNDRVNDTPG